MVANTKGFPVGLIIYYGDMRIAIACRDILDTNSSYNNEIPTNDRIKDILMRTCYIECSSRYGTGVLLDGGFKIMTAKHIIL